MRISDWSSDVCSSDLRVSDPTGTLRACGACMSKRYWRGPAVLPGTRVGPIPAENAVQNATGPAAPPPRRVLLVTGMSGAGKTTALKALEAVGFVAIDNLPLVLPIGRASCRERVCQSDTDSGGDGLLQQKTREKH